MIRSILVGILFSFSLHAGQTVTIKPGGDIILEALSDRTQVKCEGSSTSSSCYCEYKSGNYYLSLNVGNKVIALSGYLSQLHCFEALKNNPSCQ